MKTAAPIIMTAEPQSSPNARGRRLETLRHMLRLSRKQFKEKYGISASTQQAWETPKGSGLTNAGVARILPILYAEGIYCTPEWLLYGIGQSPYFNNTESSKAKGISVNHQTFIQNQSMIQELLNFRNLNENTIDFVVADDSMEPHYQPGDYVAGKQRTGKAIESLVGYDCIVQTSNNKVMLRRINSNSESGVYDLTCVNLKTTVTPSILCAQTLTCAAFVAWHRRPDNME